MSMPEGRDQPVCQDSEGGAAGGFAEEGGYKNEEKEQVSATVQLGITGDVCRNGALEVKESPSAHGWGEECPSHLSNQSHQQMESRRQSSSDEREDTHQAHLIL